MVFPDWLAIHPTVRTALETGRPVVALESTLISHGLPWPTNLATAMESEDAIRAAGVTPATIAVWNGVPTIGLFEHQLREFATTAGILKASRRDLPTAMAKGLHAATTVAATMFLARQAGISIFATGGIGGAHRDSGQDFDISADLVELARTPVLVVCAGAKSILDLPRTLEILETLSVPVVGYQTDLLPGFYLSNVNLPVPARVDDPAMAARLFMAHRKLGGGGAVLAQSLPTEVAIDGDEFQGWCEIAEREATEKQVTGASVTPFLLKRIAELSAGKTLRANQALIVANARLAALVATALSESE
ncbi:pseudouridine-5'-phosphate glycosidase [Zavarzinella formosa]|uniref:pseudouridine-5'-phosphate glycosidase n=1 Tax=Zavarzinella formosa TaxID=360055 RepID=UPI00036F88DE|nr:pseudouridine-5'-phosphate glycosidase [Zavarzinella formosa]